MLPPCFSRGLDDTLAFGFAGGTAALLVWDVVEGGVDTIIIECYNRT
jgi:hypothetical protein